jgi:hypothetical protein
MAPPPAIKIRPVPPLRAARASLQQWMARNPALNALRKQVLTVDSMWRELSPLLPPALAAAVRPGPCADGVWVLRASSPAVAAKLRLQLPLLLNRLQAGGWPLQRIALRVQMPDPAPPPAPAPGRVQPAPAAVRDKLRELRARRDAQR